jgi:hypothetical protein
VYEITTIRTVVLAEGHEHIEFVGYLSPHIENEPITITPERIAGKMAMGETFGIRVGEDLVEVIPADCPVCGAHGQLKTKKDTSSKRLLLELHHI